MIDFIKALVLTLRSAATIQDMFQRTSLHMEITLLIIRLKCLQGDLACGCEYDKEFDKDSIRKARREVRLLNREVKRRNKE